MGKSIDSIFQREIELSNVREIGTLTEPRSYGVYEVPSRAGSTRRFRFGNHPIRMRELQREFGKCSRRHLFRSRGDAREVAKALNAGEA
jgi:hypothetical protein